MRKASPTMSPAAVRRSPRCVAISHASAGSDLRARPREEDLIRIVKLGASDRALDRGNPHLLLCELDNGVSRDTLEDAVGDRGCHQDAVAHQEDVLGASLDHIPLSV